MTKLLDKAIAEVRRLPEARQDEAAEVLLSLALQDPDTIRLTDAQQREVARRLAMGSPEFASKDEVAEIFQKLEA